MSKITLRVTSTKNSASTPWIGVYITNNLQTDPEIAGFDQFEWPSTNPIFANSAAITHTLSNNNLPYSDDGLSIYDDVTFDTDVLNLTPDQYATADQLFAVLAEQHVQILNSLGSVGTRYLAWLNNYITNNYDLPFTLEIINTTP
jgi:outer membrane protein OmpA-like peptidoglycan-associated protein